jgi:Tfp pilus assembly protein PilF
LEIDPDDYFALRLRADAYWEIGENDLARDDDDQSIALEAGN